MVIIIIINNTIIIMQFSFAKLQFAGYGRFTRKEAIIYSTIRGSNNSVMKYLETTVSTFPAQIVFFLS